MIKTTLQPLVTSAACLLARPLLSGCAGIRRFRSLMAADTDNMDYAFKAKLDPGAFRRKIRVPDSGTISLSTN